MNEIKFETEKKDVIVHTPSEWNELTLEQLLYIAPRVMLVNISLRLRSEILFHLIGLKVKDYKEMNLSQLKGLFPAVDWLFKSPELTKNLIPELEIEGHNFIGPEDEIKNFSVSQFAFADKFLGQFLKTKDEQYLNLLIGTLYTIEGKPFRKEDIEAIGSTVVL
ncbi:MAG: hypothetical protein HQ522_06910, partial [Bacteroidetes bacterium]|nr:hypothetical protein [Bacteroidota bacterium]